ncbi:hypothetical protein A9G34_08915 [Gilliamella sp. Choc4-2]|nr:hypothetical protein A9G33_02005 [Gilliamella apicola]OCG43376.1 hypothetical protein A9G34_08915 [Gilliamella apicola]
MYIHYSSFSNYCKQREEFLQIITQLPMNHSSGEWDTNCDGEFETHDRKMIKVNALNKLSIYQIKELFCTITVWNIL